MKRPSSTPSRSLSSRAKFRSLSERPSTVSVLANVSENPRSPAAGGPSAGLSRPSGPQLENVIGGLRRSAVGVPCGHERAPFLERIAAAISSFSLAFDRVRERGSTTSRGKCVELPAQSRKLERKPCAVASTPIRRATSRTPCCSGRRCGRGRRDRSPAPPFP